MHIGEMFEKPIDRDIKGVIKVGQKEEENVYQELNEYVVTNELLKHFREFFSNYANSISHNTDDIGVHKEKKYAICIVFTNLFYI